MHSVVHMGALLIVVGYSVHSAESKVLS